MFVCDSVVLHRKSLSFYLLDQIFCWEKTEMLPNLTEPHLVLNCTCCFEWFIVWVCCIVAELVREVKDTISFVLYLFCGRNNLKVSGARLKKTKHIVLLFSFFSSLSLISFSLPPLCFFSLPRAHVCARIYHRNLVFLLSPLSHLCRDEGKRKLLKRWNSSNKRPWKWNLFSI